MNYIDIILGIPILWGVYRGFVNGLIMEVATTFALCLGIWSGVKFSDYGTKKAVELFNWHSPYMPLLMFAFIFLGILVVVFLIAKLLTKIAKSIALGGIDKISGALFGALKYALILSVIVFIIDSLERSYPIFSFEAKNKSLLYKPVGKLAKSVIPSLSEKHL